jgi:hypothetical protein
LAAIVCHKKIGSGTHLRRMLRDLAKFEMRHLAVDANIADTIEQFPLFALPAP